MKSLAPLTACCFLAVASYAQQTAAVPIVVSGASQSTVPVQVSDFKVEVNHQPVTAASVTSLSGKHLHYVLINDARVFSNWPGGTDQQAHVTKEILKLVISPGSDRGTLVNYGDYASLDPQNERDPKKLSSEVHADMSGPARLYDAITAGTNWLAKQQSGGDERKVVFLVCDGKDTGSHVALPEAVKALQKASLPLFVLAPSDVEKRKEGQHLRELAEQSGGRAYFLPPSTKHLTLDDLRRDLADSFLLTLNLPSQKGLLALKITTEAHSESSILSPSYVLVP